MRDKGSPPVGGGRRGGPAGKPPASLDSDAEMPGFEVRPVGGKPGVSPGRVRHGARVLEYSNRASDPASPIGAGVASLPLRRGR